MKYVVVLPYTIQQYFDDCVKTMHPDLRANLLPINNTVNNVGIMAAHNEGIQTLKVRGADWLVVLSAAIRFNEPGGMDFINELANREGHNIVEAAGVFGWHLIAFSAKTLQEVGEWDENFSPYGFDDIDYSLRVQKFYKIDGRQTQVWEKAPVDAQDMGMAHSIKIANVDSPAEPRIKYFERKWGRHPGDYENDGYDHPFNDPNNGIDFWPLPSHPLSIQNNEFKDSL